MLGRFVFGDRRTRTLQAHMFRHASGAEIDIDPLITLLDSWHYLSGVETVILGCLLDWASLTALLLIFEVQHVIVFCTFWIVDWVAGLGSVINVACIPRSVSRDSLHHLGHAPNAFHGTLISWAIIGVLSYMVHINVFSADVKLRTNKVNHTIVGRWRHLRTIKVLWLLFLLVIPAVQRKHTVYFFKIAQESIITYCWVHCVSAWMVLVALRRNICCVSSKLRVKNTRVMFRMVKDAVWVINLVASHESVLLILLIETVFPWISTEMWHFSFFNLIDNCF